MALYGPEHIAGPARDGGSAPAAYLKARGTRKGMRQRQPVRTASATPASLPLSALLLLAAAAPRAARAQAPTGVTLTRSDANTSVTVSWGFAGSADADFIVKAEPYVFQDSFNGGIKPGWVWDAPCNPSNTAGGTCIYSTSVYQGLVAIGVSAGVGFGYASGRGSSESLLPSRMQVQVGVGVPSAVAPLRGVVLVLSRAPVVVAASRCPRFLPLPAAPELLRPEVFDARSDFCSNVYADNKLVNLGYVANVQGGIVVSDADTGLPIFSRWSECVALACLLLPPRAVAAVLSSRVRPLTSLPTPCPLPLHCSHDVGRRAGAHLA
jgi:hypothetical protein